VALDGGQGARPPEPRAVGSALRSLPDLAAELDRFERVLERVRPDRVVVIEGNAPTDEVMNQACRRAGIPCICLQQGWSPIVHPGFRNMTYSTMAVWGQGFRDLLAPANPLQDFAVTGSHMLEAGAGQGDAELARELAGRRAAGFFLQSTSPVIDPRHLDELRGLATRVAGELPDAAVVVREHPGSPLEQSARAELQRLPNVVWAPADRYGLRAVLGTVSATVSIYSTTLVESAALGVPPVVLGVTSMERYSPDLEALGAGVQARDAGQAFVAVRRLLTEPGAREPFRPGMDRVSQELFAGLDGRALDRVAALVSGRGT
jgi:hypothetical protein